MVKGEEYDLSSYHTQGFGYYKDTLFFPLTGDVDRNVSVVAVYDCSEMTGGVIPSSSELSFRIESKNFPLFEIESCGICSADKKLYFNTNRRASDTDTNRDAICVFKKFTFK